MFFKILLIIISMLIPSSFMSNEQCKNHADCNILLAKMLSCTMFNDTKNYPLNNGKMIDDCNEENNRKLLKYLNLNPRIICQQNRCICNDEKFSYDPNDHLCRYRCHNDNDCRRNNYLNESTMITKNYYRHSQQLNNRIENDQQQQNNDYLQSYNRILSMICIDGQCRCPQYSRQSYFNWRKKECLEEIQIEFHDYRIVSLSIISLVFIVIILTSPIIMFLKLSKRIDRQRLKNRI